MSSDILHRTAANLKEAVVNLLWRQWAAVGGAAPTVPAHALVDPEILVLTSVALREAEPRLQVVMEDWLRVGASLLSVQRFNNIRKGFPEDIAEAIPRIAFVAEHVAKDARWKKLTLGIDHSLGDQSRQEKPRTAAPSLLDPAALMLRLRSAFGVSVKSDLLATMLGLGDRSASLSELALATQYNKSAVGRALGDLAAARMIYRNQDFPTGHVSYSLSPVRWKDVLTLDSVNNLAPSRGWVEVLSYAAKFLRWAAERERSSTTDYVLGTTWRTLAEESWPVFVRTRIVNEYGPGPIAPDPNVLAEYHERLTWWIGENA